ncbi:uncharacterized protein RCC_00653 [Ramularia collo-cygni]|uniref:Pentatricopeptide repeat protein n=1 Tax=Ramularia collo-cygni TaxID=112498 RepID=A0A2D3UQW2_9PEZI|nr:uncharacterized protein RCC_00653 [Ramularia collo-cygni]CZT14680.1 uncharacterized protein RCC_00653 [Ramularia collo-cygni]
MFSKSRRPVPSRAALRILYQLAYISSGTAVGVAALCAEERRRRTHYVQKIADNAKRLRQSPRHVHNVAAAKATQHAVHQEPGLEGNLRKEQICGDDLGREPVEMESKGARKGLVRFLQSAGKNGSDEADHNMRVPQPPARYGVHRPFVVQQHTSGRHGQDSSAPVPQDIDRLERPIGTSAPAIRLRRPRPTLRSENWKRAAELLERDEHSPRESDGIAAAIGQSTELFFKNFDMSNIPWTSTELVAKSRVASRLLEQSLRHGCLAEVRQLVSWKLANERLDELDVTALHENCSNPDFQFEMFELFAKVFQSKAFAKLPDEFKLTKAMSVAADATFWDIGLKASNCAKPLLRVTLRSSQPDTVEHAVRGLCDEYLATNQVRKAYSIVNAVRLAKSARFNPEEFFRWKQDYERIVAHAKEQGLLWLCEKYATLLIRAGRDPDWIPLVEWILSECRRSKSFASVRSLTWFLLASNDWRSLGDSAKVNFAIALSAIGKQLPDASKLDDVYNSIPKALRGPVSEAWCADRLQAVWKTQRSLAAVWAEYERAKPFQSERFGTAELTLIQICNDAKQPDEALRLLSATLKPEEHSNASLCIAAVSMAQKSAWTQLRGLLDMIAASKNFVNDRSTSRNLNATIDLYSRHHTAAETWKFVTDMIGAIGFTPNQSTSNIMLQCFVSKETLDLIPKWVRYLKIIGNDFKMTSRSATKLLDCFYFNRRPSHVLVMLYCRTLSKEWPSLRTEGLKELVTKAIGYDLRKLPAQDRPALRERAAQNLARLADRGRAVRDPYRPTSLTDTNHPRSGSSSTAAQEDADVDQLSFEPPGRESQDAEVLHRGRSELPSTGNGVYEASPINDEISHASIVSHGETCPGDDDEDLRLQSANDPASQIEHPGPSTEEPDDIHGDRHQRRVVSDMVLALSLRQYSKVMDLYQVSLSPTGLPASPLSLELATEASIRLQNGDIREATSMMEAAKEAGMEVRRAMGPLLVHRIFSLNSDDKKDANALFSMVIDYYRSNEENGFAVQHHLGVTAADTLIHHRRPEYGIHILNAVYRSAWVVHRPLDIIAMTVYLKGFAALKSKQGIIWVVRNVLSKNMLIDRRFNRALKLMLQDFGIASSVRRPYTPHRQAGFPAKLRALRQLCIQRRHQQMFQTKVFGNRLVRKILYCVEMESRPTIDLEDRVKHEEALFGGPAGLLEGSDRDTADASDPELRKEGHERTAMKVRRGRDQTDARRNMRQKRNRKWQR